MKLSFTLLFFYFLPYIIFAQFKVSSYTDSKIIFTQSKWDSVEIKKIVLESDYSSDYELEGTMLFKKKNYNINLAEKGVQTEYKKAIISYVDPVDGELKSQTIKIKMKSKWVNPFEKSIRCQAITKKGTQCSRYTTSKNGYCWQHGGN